MEFGSISLCSLYAALFIFFFSPQSPPSWQLCADIVFTVLFALEMSLKLAALGVRLYFKDAWNWLDATVVVEVCIYAERPVVALPIFFFPSHYSPFFSLPLRTAVGTQIQDHIAGSSPPSPLRFVPCIFIARRRQPFLPVIDSRRTMMHVFVPVD